MKKDEKTKEKEHDVKSLSMLIVLCWSWLILAIFVCLLSAFLPLFPEGESQLSWFQRSGSVLVVFTVWVQFKLSGVQVYFETGGYQIPFDIPRPLGVVHFITVIANTTGMILGTVIWGYGDILIRIFL
ncbi:hypothetical protein [uncultured Pseudoteredinibacter sp.]|uniref:hypothetical protein n=1 Tax=uncultured Pseudoteredinibacter sp. TaxID=1641701 RepID=UPI00262D3616|nr:hypothetical protein [uncultured Pseudoteredinibacter sp.]